MTNEQDIDDFLFAMSPSRQLILNFMKSVGLISAARCLETSSKENIEKANSIMNDIIEGYQLEEHSVQ